MFPTTPTPTAGVTLECSDTTDPMWIVWGGFRSSRGVSGHYANAAAARKAATTAKAKAPRLEFRVVHPDGTTEAA